MNPAGDKDPYVIQLTREDENWLQERRKELRAKRLGEQTAGGDRKQLDEGPAPPVAEK